MCASRCRYDDLMNSEAIESASWYVQHHDWLARIPNRRSVSDEWVTLSQAMLGWIDEFTEEFCDERHSVRLSERIDVEACCVRMLNLMSGPCEAFLAKKTSHQPIYKKVYKLMDSYIETPPESMEIGMSGVRELYRAYGQQDGIRHCIMVTAIVARQESAIALFSKEFGGILKRLEKEYSGQLDQMTLEGIWQDTIAELVVAPEGQ